MKRRHFLRISATASPLLATSCEKIKSFRKSQPEEFTWRGTLLRTPAKIHFQQITQEQAQIVVSALDAELARLESIFSLSRTGSLLSLLNLQGRALLTDLDFLELLNKTLTFSRLTDGIFDPSIQSYLEKFRLASETGSPMSAEEKEDALSLVNYRAIISGGSRVEFTTPGMKLTFNGIIKGYITDRIHNLLKDAGFTNILIHLGEYRALGTRESSKPWKLHLSQENTYGALEGEILELSDGAIAISCGEKETYSSDGSAHHLINPMTGNCYPASRTIAIKAPDATTADALSTACAVTTPEKAVALVERFPGTTLLYDTMVA